MGWSRDRLALGWARPTYALRLARAPRERGRQISHGVCGDRPDYLDARATGPHLHGIAHRETKAGVERTRAEHALPTRPACKASPHGLALHRAANVRQARTLGRGPVTRGARNVCDLRDPHNIHTIRDICDIRGIHDLRNFFTARAPRACVLYIPARAAAAATRKHHIASVRIRPRDHFDLT